MEDDFIQSIVFVELLSLNGEPPDICLYEALLAANSSLDQQVLKSYARRQISIILSHNPILKGKPF